MNIFDDKVEVDKPQGISTQSLMLYVPKVTTQNAGIATYDNEDFIISKGNVSLYKLYNIAEITYDDTHLARSGAVKQYIDLVRVDLDDVKKELAEKASILYVDTQDDIIKQSIANLNITLTDEINKKADITYIDEKLDDKADITYVDSKFNNMKSYVDNNISILNGNIITINNNIGTINDRINAIVGIGGYLAAHNFGTSTPTQQELTDYALSQISSISSADEIWNGTKVTNSYDNHTWVLTNTPDTEPAIFEWSDIGFEFISTATNEQLGVVKGSVDDYKVSVADDGTMSINNLELKLEMIDSDFRDIDAKFLEINGTINTLETEIENNIGLIDKVAFVGILEDNRLKFYLDESQKDFEFRNNREYNLLLHLPLTTLTGDLDNNLPIDLYNKAISQKNDATQIARIVLNSILSNDPTNTTTVGKLCQLQNYSPTNGYTWNFNGDYSQYEENGIIHRVMYTTDVTRESNSSMTGSDLAMAISDATLKTGTTVIVTSDYTDNGYNYIAGHTYLIQGEWIDNELILSTLELQTGGGTTYTAGNNISIEDNVIDTKNVLRLDSSDLQECSGFTLGKVYRPSSGTISGVNYEPNSSGDVDLNIGHYKPGTTLAYDYHRMRIRGGQYNGMISHLHQGVIGSLKFPIGNYDLNLPVKNGTLATTDDLPKYSGLVLTQMNGNVNGDTVNLTFDKVNLATGESENADTYQFGPASETNPGLMTSADVKALSDLQQRVGNLETKTTRLIYTAKTDPTAEEINTFVTGLGYTAPFSGIAVVVDKTYHIWHYYENDGWKDDGMDTVNLFTNETAGAIKGAGEITGKVYAENDGTGSVYGWDALNTKVDGKQDTLTAGNNISITDGTIDTKNVLRLDNENNPVTISSGIIRLTRSNNLMSFNLNNNTGIEITNSTGKFINQSINNLYSTVDEDTITSRISLGDNVTHKRVVLSNEYLYCNKSNTDKFKYEFPNKSGTFALTEDLSSYLKLDNTEPTAQDYSLINLGQNLSATNRFLGLTAYKYYKDDKNYNINYKFGNYNPNGRTQSGDDNGLSLIVSNGNDIKDVFLMKNQSTQFRFPDKSGTFALTSDISSAQGITITALSGTLTTEQLNILKASTENYIKIDVGEEGKPTYFISRYIGTETITVEGVNVTEIQYILPMGYQLILIAVNSETGVYENKTMALQSDLDEYVINLSGESGTLTSEQISAIQSGNVNARIKLQVSTEDTTLYYTYYEYNSTTNIRDYYFEGIRDGIEYSIHCEINIADTSTWTLTKRYLEIEVPLNDDNTISDESLALIEKYGEHTYIMNSNIRYNFVIKEIGEKNFIKYSNIENDVGRTITVWTDDKTWMEQYKYLAEKPDMNGGFKLYNDQWEASESSYGSFKQVVSYTHYANNFNEYTILPLSSNLRMWAECGVGAFEETANDITFYAQTKPTDSLSFNIKHERVEYSEV